MTFIYMTKILLGTAQGLILGEGKYLTAVNVHNPNSFPVIFTKKVIFSARENEAPIPPSPVIEATLEPDDAMEIDNPDIRDIANAPDPIFIKGFLNIECQSELDVVGVYTFNSPTGSSLQVLPIIARSMPTLVPEPATVTPSVTYTATNPTPSRNKYKIKT